MTPITTIHRTLSHPMRKDVLLRIVDSRARRGVSPKMLADALGVKLPNLSYHVTILAGDGLIEESDSEPRRGAVEHYYKPTKLGRTAARVARAADKAAAA